MHDNDPELFWESLQDHGWKPNGVLLASPDDSDIAVAKNRHIWYHGIDTRVRFTDAKYAKLLRFESDPKVQTKWCSQNHLLLRFASFKSVQLAAVRREWWTIKYIENPSEAVKLAAVQTHCYSIKHIRNPSEALQLEAVRRNWQAIQHIKNPSKAVKRAARR
jgi:hypothetical protein